MLNSAGDELDAFLGRQVQPYDLMAYVGDGENDFCPILRLRRFYISDFG